MDGAPSPHFGLGQMLTFFFLTLGPSSAIRPFVQITQHQDDATRRRVALSATLVAGLYVIVAATIGILILARWGISYAALIIAAGILLFLVALHAIRAQYLPADPASSGLTYTALWETASRIAFPYIVSPYGIAVVILILSVRTDEVSRLEVTTVLGAIMLLNAVALLQAHRISRSSYLAPSLNILASVLAVLQAALGVQAVLFGISLYLRSIG